jgi:Putative auto-transporter adhesin, head GIN domain
VGGGPDRGVRWCTARVAPAVVLLAMTALLAGCLGTSAGPSPGSAGTGTPGTSRPGAGDNGGNGGRGGDGGDGYGGWGGNGYGGDGGDADGKPGAQGAPGAPGGGFANSTVTGSGRLTSRTIDLSGVTSVVAGAHFVVHLRIGGPAQAAVAMDDNLVDRVEATVIGETLRLGIKPGMSVRDATLSADVTVGRLDRLASSAASRVVLTSAITSPALQVDMSGASSITGPISVGQAQAEVSGAANLGLSGQVQDLHLRAAGASRLPLAGLTVGNLDATLSGASHAVVTVSDTLAVQASGASVLRYRGMPHITRSQTAGMSSVVPDSP